MKKEKAKEINSIIFSLPGVFLMLGILLVTGPVVLILPGLFLGWWVVDFFIEDHYYGKEGKEKYKQYLLEHGEENGPDKEKSP